MKSPFHHIRHPESLFEHFHKKIHHTFAIFTLAIVGMLRGASNILTPTSASRQWGSFITNEVWDQSPTEANIMYSLFGDGTPGSTAYTQLWSSSCVPTNAIVSYTTGSFHGGNLLANTIYKLDPGTYTLTSPITFNGDCITLIGRGEVTIKGLGHSIVANNRSKIIIDNIKFEGNGTQTGLDLNGATNTTINNVDIFNTNKGIYSVTGGILVNNSRLFNNSYGFYGLSGSNTNIQTINNSLIYNNTYGAYVGELLINNSQIFNNTNGLHTLVLVANGTIVYNNIQGVTSPVTITNNVYFYNNGTGISAVISALYLGTLKFFGNNSDLGGGTTLSGQITWNSLPRSEGQLDTGSVSLDYDRVTNPQNGSGQVLLSGTLSSLRGTGNAFDISKKPLRYIFGNNIPKQTKPIYYYMSGSQELLIEYGNDGKEYFTTKYIAEPESSLPLLQQAIIAQYFGSGSTFTQNWDNNGCSLSAFQIKTLDPDIYNNNNNKFEDHTIYLLTGGEYSYGIGTTGNGFIFNGNCIALIGTHDTRFTKLGTMSMNSLLYANNKRNIIIDNIKVDGLYFFPSNPTLFRAQTAIKFDGSTNNTTINNVQTYNTDEYGIYLGLGSHHNTIMNSQSFNNRVAGIILYYVSNYNVINNTQTYNNGQYGIWFANGSSRNAMNNFQSYNNGEYGIFGDLTTQENILNRAAIYNNSGAGILFKNSSGNILNDVKIYNNTVGIRMMYSSLGNKYYGELKPFANLSGNFDGTSGNDSSLSAGVAGTSFTAGIMNTGTATMSCLEVANPTLSGTIQTLLTNDCSNIGHDIAGFTSPLNTYVNYAFGLNMYKQRIPVRYISGSLSLLPIPSQYDSGKYIAEVFAIRDNIPEGVGFASSGSVELNSWYTTTIYTAGVVNMPVPIELSFSPSTTSGYLIISGNILSQRTGIVNNGDLIQVKLLTTSGRNETITGYITVGSAPISSFSVTTRGYITTPSTGSLTFPNFTSIALNTFVESTGTIVGIETGVLASISFMPSTTSGRLEIYSGGIYMTGGTTGLTVYSGNQVKVIAKSSSGYAQTITGNIIIGGGTGMFTLSTKGFDTTPPTTPIITYPLSGEELFFVTFEWLTPSIDSGAGIEGYLYQIASDSNFVDVAYTGFISTVTGTIGSPSTEFDATSDTFYWRLKAKDRDGNYSTRSNTGVFVAIESTNRDFPEKTNANLRTNYNSEEITLEGIKQGATIWAKIDGNGTLYKDGNDKGTGTVVQNNDKLYITLRSSNIYDTTVSSTLTIANRELEFVVTTKEEGDDSCTLSDEDENTIQIIYDSLVENYSGDEDRFNEFLATMQSMLADEIDFTNDCNLQYLQDLINGDIDIGLTGSVDTGNHIAPNCKEYPVAFDTSMQAYTSPTFKVATYFANRDSLLRYIDSKNPGDCHINTYGVSSRVFTNTDSTRHIAPNGKVYPISFESQGYTSNGFSTVKYFSTINNLRSYINSKNIPSEIRSHEVDTSFTPQAYIAPNAKEYTIYKTNRGYMSYKLLKVRYFTSLSEIQSFISRNNRK